MNELVDEFMQEYKDNMNKAIGFHSHIAGAAELGAVFLEELFLGLFQHFCFGLFFLHIEFRFVHGSFLFFVLTHVIILQNGTPQLGPESPAVKAWKVGKTQRLRAST